MQDSVGDCGIEVLGSHQPVAHGITEIPPTRIRQQDAEVGGGARAEGLDQDRVAEQLVERPPAHASMPYPRGVRAREQA